MSFGDIDMAEQADIERREPLFERLKSIVSLQRLPGFQGFTSVVPEAPAAGAPPTTRDTANTTTPDEFLRFCVAFTMQHMHLALDQQTDEAMERTAAEKAPAQGVTAETHAAAKQQAVQNLEPLAAGAVGMVYDASGYGWDVPLPLASSAVQTFEDVLQRAVQHPFTFASGCKSPLDSQTPTWLPEAVRATLCLSRTGVTRGSESAGSLHHLSVMQQAANACMNTQEREAVRLRLKRQFMPRLTSLGAMRAHLVAKRNQPENQGSPDSQYVNPVEAYEAVLNVVQDASGSVFDARYLLRQLELQQWDASLVCRQPLESFGQEALRVPWENFLEKVFLLCCNNNNSATCLPPCVAASQVCAASLEALQGCTDSGAMQVPQPPPSTAALEHADRFAMRDEGEDQSPGAGSTGSSGAPSTPSWFADTMRAVRAAPGASLNPDQFRQTTNVGGIRLNPTVQTSPGTNDAIMRRLGLGPPSQK